MTPAKPWGLVPIATDIRWAARQIAVNCGFAPSLGQEPTSNCCAYRSLTERRALLISELCLQWVVLSSLFLDRP